MRVLIVEPDEDLRDALVITCDTLRILPVIARDFKHLGNSLYGRIDAALLEKDLYPESQIRDWIAQIKEMQPKCHIILMADTPKMEMFKLGVSALIQRPFGLKELAEILEVRYT